jgi:hypothetical protein
MRIAVPPNTSRYLPNATARSDERLRHCPEVKETHALLTQLLQFEYKTTGIVPAQLVKIQHWNLATLCISFPLA